MSNSKLHFGLVEWNKEGEASSTANLDQQTLFGLAVMHYRTYGYILSGHDKYNSIPQVSAPEVELSLAAMCSHMLGYNRVNLGGVAMHIFVSLDVRFLRVMSFL